MPLERKKIEDALKAAHTDVQNKLSAQNLGARVKAIQFLLPDTHKLDEIQPFLYSEQGTQSIYEDASNLYVFGGTSSDSKPQVVRSLYYLKFDEPFRYHCFNEDQLRDTNPVEFEIEDDQFNPHKNPPVPISATERKELEKNSNLEPFWEAWYNALRDKKYGYSTLWTYVLIRKGGEDNSAISSGIIVFDGCLGSSSDTEDPQYKLLSYIGKRVQESLYELTLDLFKSEITHQATRAAISQIMARNMSHNIGSHVSYKSTNIAIKKRIIKLYSTNFTKKEEIERIRELNANEAIVDWIDFMSEKLDKYEIHRNEYLADYNLSPQSFRFYQDVILPFCENTLILDNLASAEGANYAIPDKSKATPNENNLKIRVFVKNECDDCYEEIKVEYPSLMCVFPGNGCDEKISYPDHFPYLLKSVCTKELLSDGINAKKLTSEKDVEVLLHSEQGVYSILENFIRNSAKHNKEALATKPLEVRMYLEERGDRYNLILTDNVSELETTELFNGDSERPGLFQRISKGIVGDLEQSIKQNLGFADMNINSFLFKHTASDISNETLSSNFHLVNISGDLCNLVAKRIRSGCVHLDPAVKHPFGYEMELLKPLRVLWIGEDIGLRSGDKNISSLRGNGVVQFKSLSAYSDECSKGKDEIAAFDFVVIYKNFDYLEYLKNQIMLPLRVLVVTDGDNKSPEKPNIKYVNERFDGISSADDLVETCWELWLDRLPKKAAAYIYYENNEKAAAQLDEIKTHLRGGHSIKSVNNLDQRTIISNENIAVIYDHHGRVFEGNDLQHTLELEKQDKKPAINFYTGHSKIVFDKGSDDYVRLNSLPADDLKKRLLAYQLIDAATTNIFVLDERIAIAANNDCSNTNDKSVGIKFGKYDSLNFSRYCYGKVFAINNISVNGGEDKPVHSGEQNYRLSLHISAETIGLKADREANRVLADVDRIGKDLLVIHRTYMKEEALGMEVKEFLNLASKIFGSVVVTSGGGYPHSINEQVRFIPFSIIHQCISSRLAKLKLVTFLQKLRFVR